MPQFMPPSASANVYSGSSIHTASTTNSLEPAPTRKRPRWDLSNDNDDDVDGLLKDTKSTVSSNAIDSAPLEPLPLPLSGPGACSAPPAVPRMLSHVPMMQHSQMAPGLGLYASRMMGYPTQFPMAPPVAPMMAHRAQKMHPTQKTPSSSMLSPEIGKLDEIMAETLKQTPNENRMSLDNAVTSSMSMNMNISTNCNNNRMSLDESVSVSERKSVEEEDHCDDNGYLDDHDLPIPPEIAGDNLYPLSLLGDNEEMQVIEGTVDECGSVMEFQSETKDGSGLYL